MTVLRDGAGQVDRPGHRHLRLHPRPRRRLRSRRLRTGPAAGRRRPSGGRSAGSGGTVTKSIRRSIALISGVSTSAKLSTRDRMRRHISAGSATPSAAQTPSFHGRPGGTTGHARDAQRGRLHRLPDVDVRVPGDQHVRRGHPGHDPALLGAGHQVVDEHAEPAAAGRGRTSRTCARRGRRCRPAAPPPRPRPAGRRPRSARPGRRRGCPRPRSGWPWPPGPRTLGHRDRAGGGPPAGRRGTAARRRAAQRHRPPVEQERGRQQREVAPPPVPVLQHHRAGLEADHRAAEPGVGVLHHQVRLGVHLGGDLAPPPVTGQHVLAVSPRHADTLTRQRRPRRSPTRRSPPIMEPCAARSARTGHPTAVADAGRARHRRRQPRQGRRRARTLSACPPPQRARPRSPPRRSSRFVAWVRAWRAGLVPFDEVADADRRRRGAPRRRRPRHLDRRAAARRAAHPGQALPRRDPAGAARARRPARAARPGRLRRRGAARRARRWWPAGSGLIPRGPQPHLRLRDDLRDGALAGLPAAGRRARRVADDARRRRGRGRAGRRAGRDDRRR